MLGINKGNVKLVPHSTNWKYLFEKEKELLNSIIGEHVVDIQHIGSTSINHIAAKPIIDIIAGVKSLNDVEKFDKDRMKEKDYYRLKVVIDGKIVFSKFSCLKTFTKTHILHVVEYEGEWWKQHTFFRDYLNANQDVAKDYEELKMDLAKKFPNDNASYTDEKKKFVDAILDKKGK